MRKPDKLVIKDIVSENHLNKEIVVKGWIRTKRGNKSIAFVALNDGSCIENLQVVLDVEKFDETTLKRLTTGAAVAASGLLKKSEGKGQSIELHANEITIIGDCDAEEFPLQPKKHSLEFLREIAHLRFRTNTFGAINRIRHAMTFAIHQYFNDKGFFNIHTPILTASDCEGAGEMFQVTTLGLKNVPKDENGEVDYSKDFFGIPANLTVSGQLEGELAAMGLSQVYTFGPTFRAENSNTSRHLSEFWMVEPEVAFNNLNDNMNLAEDFLKYLIKYALDNCSSDLNYLSQRQQQEEKSKKQDERAMELLEKLNFVVDNEFVRLTYSEAIKILEQSKANKKGKFQYPVNGFGTDLQSEHERYLVEKHFKKPVILTDYPKDIKAFYMKQNIDGKTVRAMDVLFPNIGEIIGGSQREEDYTKLINRMDEMAISQKELWWYLDTRRFGSVPHSGFGLGFERLLLFVTGMSNIRDVIPFPRTPKNIHF